MTDGVGESEPQAEEKPAPKRRRAAPKTTAAKSAGATKAPAADKPAAAKSAPGEGDGGAVAAKLGKKIRGGAKALENVSRTDLELLEWLETQDPIRRHAIRSLFTRSFLILSLTVGVGAAYTLQAPIMERWILSAGVFAALAVVFFGGVIFVAYEPIRTFRSRIKRAIIPELASRHGLAYETDTTNASPSAVFEKQGLAPFHDRSVVDDVFRGEVRGCPITLIEGRLQVKSWKGYADVFNGLFIDVKTPTMIANPVVVAEALNIAVQRRRKMDAYGLNESPVSDDAKERLALYGEQARDARIIAETKFLDALLALEAILHGVRIQAVLEPERVLLLVRTNFNFFELGSVRQTLAQPETLRHFREDLAIFEEIVSTLQTHLPEKGRGAAATARERAPRS